MISVGGRYLQHDQLIDHMKMLLGHMSQNVTTVECLIYSMSCHQDQLEVREKMKETTDQLEELIPLMRSYLALPEPEHPISRQRWWMHRARINRELEVILHNFHLLHVVLSAAEYNISSNAIRSILQAEMKKLESSKPRYISADYYDDTADIVAQAEKTFLLFVNHYSDRRTSGYSPALSENYWASVNNNNYNNNNNEKSITDNMSDFPDSPRSPGPMPILINGTLPGAAVATVVKTPPHKKSHKSPRKGSHSHKKEHERKHFCTVQ